MNDLHFIRYIYIIIYEKSGLLPVRLKPIELVPFPGGRPETGFAMRSGQAAVNHVLLIQ